MDYKNKEISMDEEYKAWDSKLKTLGGFRFLASQEFKKLNTALENYNKNKTIINKKAIEKAMDVWSKSVKYAHESQKMGTDIVDNIKDALGNAKVKIIQTGKLPQPKAIHNGACIVYRGDEREPDDIGESGFDLWPAAKATLKQSGGIANWFCDQVYTTHKNSGDFADYVRQAKNRSRPTISTSLDENCGGYDSGYIYKVKLPGCKQLEMSKAVMGKRAPIPWATPLQLYLDTGNIGTANIIGVNLNLGTFEVAFLKKIDPKYIIQYREPKQQQWHDMPNLALTVT